MHRAAAAADGGSGLGDARAGLSLLELLVVLALLGIVAQVGGPSFVRWRARQQLEAAARHLGLDLLRACASAVASGRVHGLRLEAGGGGLVWGLVADGDGDGIRSADLAAGIDGPVEAPLRLGAMYPGVEAGRPSGVPPLPGSAAGRDGLAFGNSPAVSCSARGTARSGTLYLRSTHDDGAAVRVYGATGRITLWWWDARRLGWIVLG